MDLGISEFTFGYAFLFEQTQRSWGGLKAAPVLPSLVQEAGLGWDAMLPTAAADFYFQFKMAERMVRASALHAAFGIPHFRFGLHRRDGSRQHRNLWEHAQAHPDTFYVAPEIKDAGAFNNAFLGNGVTDSSRLVRVSSCPQLAEGDTEQHYVLYAPGREAEFRSESRGRVSSFAGQGISEIYGGGRRRMRRVDSQFALDLLRVAEAPLERILRGSGSEEEREIAGAVHRALGASVQRDVPQTLALAAKALAVGLGVALVLVGERS